MDVSTLLGKAEGEVQVPLSRGDRRAKASRDTPGQMRLHAVAMRFLLEGHPPLAAIKKGREELRLQRRARGKRARAARRLNRKG